MKYINTEKLSDSLTRIESVVLDLDLRRKQMIEGGISPSELLNHIAEATDFIVREIEANQRVLKRERAK